MASQSGGEDVEVRAARPPALQIQTERLELRPMTIADLDDFLSLHTDPDVVRFLGEVDEQLAIMRLNTDARVWNERGHGLFKVTHRGDGRFLGRVGLRYWPQFDETEVGWTLARNEWGHGFATEASVACVRWGFRELRVPYLISCIQPDNARSIAVAERLGMARLRNDVLDGIPAIGGEALNGIRVVIYAITREDWARERAVPTAPSTGRPSSARGAGSRGPDRASPPRPPRPRP